MKTQLLTTIAIGGALGAGCATQQEPKPEPPPQAKIERLFPQPDSLDASKLQMKVAVYNPRSAAITLESIAWSVDTGDVAGVLEGEERIDASLESEQVAEIDIPVTVPFPVANEEAYKAILEKDTIPLEVKGEARFGSAGNASFGRKGAVATPSLPKLVIHDAQAAKYGKEGVDLTIFLRLINENAFTVTVGVVDYTVEVYGKEVAKRQAGIGTTLVAGAAQEFEESMKLEEASFEGVTEELRTGRIEYRVYGTVSVNEVEKEFDHSGEIELQMD